MITERLLRPGPRTNYFDRFLSFNKHSELNVKKIYYFYSISKALFYYRVDTRVSKMLIVTMIISTEAIKLLFVLS